MTKDEILNMPAGEELDTLVAEKVMGWRKEHEKDWRDVWRGADGRYQHPTGRYDGYEDREDFHTINWHPSESILWVWEVVEKFYSMKLDKYSNGEEWRCYLVTERDGKNVDANATADSAELAICRAALLTTLERESD